MSRLIRFLFSFVKKNKLITVAGLFVLASMSANAINWMLNILAGRVLDTDEYATYAVFISIMGLLSVPANALATTISRYYAYYSGKENNSSLKDLITHYKFLSLVLGLVAVASVFLLNDFIQDFFKLPSNRMVLGFAPVAFFLFTAAYFRGVLKGKLRFGTVGLMMIIESMSKLVLLSTGYLLELPLIAIAVISLPISWFLASLIGAIGSMLKNEIQIKPSEVSQFSKYESHFFMTNAFFSSIGMMLLNSVDILLVKHFFSDSVAGTYALLSLFGKILYFGAGSFIELFVPLTAKAFAQNAGSRTQFFKLLGLVSSVAIPTLAVFLLFPNQITHLFLGEKGYVVLPYFAPYLFATTFLLYTNCFNAYNAAKKQFLSSYLFSIMAVVQGALIYYWHSSLLEVVNIVLITQAILFAGVLIYEFFISPRLSQKKNTSSSLNNLLLSGTKNVFKREIVDKSISIPDSLRGFRLSEEIQSPGLEKPHLIGIYDRITGGVQKIDNKILVKIWTGKDKNFSYYALKHEAKLFEIMTNVLQRNRESIPEHLKRISIPKLMFLEENENQLILATEFVSGKLARNISPEKQSKIYLQAVELLRFIGENTTEKEKKEIGYRTFYNYIFLYPALLGVSIIRQPKNSLQLIKAGLIFLRNIPVMRKSNTLTLVHRDLHTHNLIVSKNKSWIIDLARCTFTYPIYEYVTTLPIEWNNTVFRNKLLEQIKDYSKNDPDFKKLFIGLLANFVTHGLTANNLPSVNIDRYKKVLNYVNTGKRTDSSI